MLPKQVFHDIGLVAIADITTIAQMEQLVLPHMTRQLALVAALFQAHIASEVLLS